MSASARLRLLPETEDLGWTPYAWLIYLPVFFVAPAWGHASQAVWLLHICGALVFLASYFRAYWLRDRQLLVVIAVQVGLAMAFTPINPGAFVFFLYAASCAARLDREREALAAIAAIWLAGFAAAFVSHAPATYWLAHGVFVPFIGGLNLHTVEVGRANARLRLAHDEIRHLAAVAERERISRDLHDVLGHTLSLIVLKTELASKLAERDPARAFREIRDVEEVSRTALREVRDAIRGYRPSLGGELAHARSILAAARIDARFDEQLDLSALESNRDTIEVLALALREAVTNVARHSGASHATIRLWRDDSRAVLEVADDGRGIDGGEGAGLRGMRERVESVGGHMTHSSDGGLRLTVAVPLLAMARA
jgi:two-component system sensor histidine kinase DesK